MENGKAGHAPADIDVFLIARRMKRFPEEVRQYREEYPRDYAWMWASEIAINAASEELSKRKNG
jgi:hypothetical protein